MANLREKLTEPGPLINAHRGYWRHAPENSRAAIMAAGSFDMVEIDVQLSADGVPFVMHDPTLQRTAGLPDAVGSLTAAQLVNTQLLQSEETVPTLDDALKSGPDHLLFDIDVKNPDELDAVGAYLASCIERDRVMIKRDVRDPESLSKLLDLQERCGVTVIAKIKLQKLADVLLVEQAFDAGVVAAEVAFARTEFLISACATGLPISVYTLDEIACDGFSDEKGRQNPEAVWGRLADIGVRLIMTDAPAEAAHHFAGSRYSQIV
ncbi:MAG: glycerophosphodiester phosphodiesterase family protein [Pseudomonadota bacterium]